MAPSFEPPKPSPNSDLTPQRDRFAQRPHELSGLNLPKVDAVISVAIGIGKQLFNGIEIPSVESIVNSSLSSLEQVANSNHLKFTELMDKTPGALSGLYFSGRKEKDLNEILEKQTQPKRDSSDEGDIWVSGVREDVGSAQSRLEQAMSVARASYNYSLPDIGSVAYGDTNPGGIMIFKSDKPLFAETFRSEKAQPHEAVKAMISVNPENWDKTYVGVIPISEISEGIDAMPHLVGDKGSLTKLDSLPRIELSQQFVAQAILSKVLEKTLGRESISDIARSDNQEIRTTAGPNTSMYGTMNRIKMATAEFLEGFLGIDNLPESLKKHVPVYRAVDRDKIGTPGMYGDGTYWSIGKSGRDYSERNFINQENVDRVMLRSTIGRLEAAGAKLNIHHSEPKLFAEHSKSLQQHRDFEVI